MKAKWTILPCMLLLSGIATAQLSVSVPAGTALMVKLQTTLATFSNKAGDPFQARLTQPVVLEGKTIIPAGAMVEGRVTKISEPRRISGKPTIGIMPEALVLPTGERLFLDASLVDTDLGRGTDVNQEGIFKGAGHDRKDTTGNWGSRSRRNVNWRSDWRRPRSADRRGGRSGSHDGSLARKTPFSHPACWHGADYRVESRHGTDHCGGQRGTIRFIYRR